jgi:hypothetical protein
MGKNKRQSKITIDQLLGQDEVKTLLSHLAEECDKRCITSLVVSWTDDEGAVGYDACGNSMMQLIGMCEWTKLGLMAEFSDSEEDGEE